jgi:hypothetical protein
VTGLRDILIFAAFCALGLGIAVVAAHAQPAPDGDSAPVITPDPSPPPTEAPDGPAAPGGAEGDEGDEGDRVAPETPGGILSAGIEAARIGDWLAVGALALMLIGWGARRVIGFVAPAWAASKGGGKIIGAGMAFATTLGTIMYAAGFSWGAVFAAIAAATSAAGAWSLLPSGAKAKTLPKVAEA